MNKSNINVVELFAGVGGFRLGLENSSERFKTIWANQWEPSRKTQHAFNCYVHNFGDDSENINENINIVKEDIPKHDLLVGGFPCQDYSVARTGAKGIEGKKGVLWWDIYDAINVSRPDYVLLENVDRLLKSPTSQRGRDFGVMLRCFHDLNYNVEWRVINSADYGFPQRRRRVFIFAYQRKTKIDKKLNASNSKDYYKYLTTDSFFSRKFPVIKDENSKIDKIIIDKKNYKDLTFISKKFDFNFLKSGLMVNGNIFTIETQAIEENTATLRDILIGDEIDEKYFLGKNLDKWKYLKGAKKIPRKKPNGEKYFYSEGGMFFPDNIDSPSRTMLTSESSVNRSTHVVKDIKTKKLRLLTPVECERLNGFPDNWTDTGMPEKYRYFVMGNALVVPVVTMIGDTILELL